MNSKYFDSVETVLGNKLRVVTIKNDALIFSAQLGVKVGSMYENGDEKGLSHLIEHMLFKGTERRTNSDINSDIEERGGSYTAYTTYSDTIYGITGLSEELEPSLDIISDIVINPTFPLEEFEKEKSVIISEIKSGLDDLEHYSYALAHRLAFDKSFLKWDIAGNEKLIRECTIERMKEFYREHYQPNNSILTIVSPYEHRDAISLAEKYFSSWRAGECKELAIEDEVNRPIEGVKHKKDIEQSTIIYLYTFYGLTRREEIALEILNYRLGESPNSILFKELREDMGLTYDVYSDMDSSDHVKLLNIYTSLHPEDVKKARQTIESIVEGLKDGYLIEERNIDIMKKVIKTAIASTMIDPESLCNYVLGQLVSDKSLHAFEEDLETLNSITKEEVIAVARKVLVDPTIQIVLNDED
jgi:predicted Zn-dependent peptidase